MHSVFVYSYREYISHSLDNPILHCSSTQRWSNQQPAALPSYPCLFRLFLSESGNHLVVHSFLFLAQPCCFRSSWKTTYTAKAKKSYAKPGSSLIFQKEMNSEFSSRIEEDFCPSSPCSGRNTTSPIG